MHSALDIIHSFHASQFYGLPLSVMFRCCYHALYQFCPLGTKLNKSLRDPTRFALIFSLFLSLHVSSYSWR